VTRGVTTNDTRGAVPVSLCHDAGSALEVVLLAARRTGAAGLDALLWGEPGTGKLDLARLLHDAADPAAPFLMVQCRGREERAVALELFGEGTAEPGAREDRLAAARGGTLVLEEIGEVPLELQGKLVQAIMSEDRPAAPGGTRRPRLVATSTRELLPLVERGGFRRDLYDMLSTKLRLPPLRERRGDVLAIAELAWAAAGERRKIADDARALIGQYAWPGNAFELVSFVRRLALDAAGPVVTVRDVERGLFTMVTGLSCWGPRARAGAEEAPDAGGTAADATRRVLLEAGLAFVGDDRLDLVALLQHVEARLVDWALQRAAGSRTVAADLLGMHRTTLVEKLRRRRIRPVARAGDASGLSDDGEEPRREAP
jgi:DNA-binding NtrC family response regulator